MLNTVQSNVPKIPGVRSETDSPKSEKVADTKSQDNRMTEKSGDEKDAKPAQDIQEGGVRLSEENNRQDQRSSDRRRGEKV